MQHISKCNQHKGVPENNWYNTRRQAGKSKHEVQMTNECLSQTEGTESMQLLMIGLLLVFLTKVDNRINHTVQFSLNWNRQSRC